MMSEIAPVLYLADTVVRDARATTAAVVVNDAMNASVEADRVDYVHRSANKPFSGSLSRECHTVVPP